MPKIVYETPSGDIEEVELDNGDLSYNNDHWQVTVDENEDEQNIRRIPRERVFEVVETLVKQRGSDDSGVDSF